MTIDNFPVKECVGCGCCCLKAKCSAAVRLYPAAKVCPQLLWSEEDGRYLCGLMLLPGQVGEAYRKELYAGEGCCMGLNSWRLDVKRRDLSDASDNSIQNPLDKYFQMFLYALGKQLVSGDMLTLTVLDFCGIMERNNVLVDEIERVKKAVVRTFLDNRSSYMKDFMG